LRRAEERGRRVLRTNRPERLRSKLDLVLSARSELALTTAKATLVYGDNQQGKCNDEGHHHGPENHLVHSMPHSDPIPLAQASGHVTHFSILNRAFITTRRGFDTGHAALRIAITRMSVQVG
jgi:hypothetical protein